MTGIIEFPQIVREALQDFGDLFANEPQRRHFAEYLTGLFVAAVPLTATIEPADEFRAWLFERLGLPARLQ